MNDTQCLLEAPRQPTAARWIQEDRPRQRKPCHASLPGGVECPHPCPQV